MTLPSVFAGRCVVHFIDNISSMWSLVKGYSRAIDTGLIVNAFHAYNAGLRADVFFEYVRSDANIADLPSRMALEELWEKFQEVGISRDVVWHECVLPEISDWGAQAEYWIKKGHRAIKKRKCAD